MKTTEDWEREGPDTVEATVPDGDDVQTAAGRSITSLRELTFTLLRKVESIGEVHTPDIEGGLDFYDEVSRFEIDLIRRALIRTGGHQRRAARLLNLKVTTLNSKIKHYNIHVVGGDYNYPLVKTNEMETRRGA